MKKVKWVMVLFGLCCQMVLAACLDDDAGEDGTTVFRLLSTTPERVRDTIFVNNAVQTLTVELESNVDCKSTQPSWLKRAVSPALENNRLTVKYVVEKYLENGWRDGEITLTAADGSLSYALKVKQTNRVEDTRTLLFCDDFEGNTLDISKWIYEPKAGSAWNYYVSNGTEQVEVKEGNLYLRATWDAASHPPKTGAVSTHGKFSMEYGEIQVKAKFTRAGQGGWPAIWMMPQTPLFQGWPDCGELDIMERLNQEAKIYSTVHLNEAYRPDPYTVTPVIDPSDYNIYGMKKYPGKVEFYLNGEKTLTVEKPESLTDGKAWPFDTDFYLILNQACADQGASGLSFWPGLVSDSSLLPFEMAVDWVKVYALEEK